MSVEIVTFGCRLNTYESEIMRKLAAVEPGARPRVVLNTCAVTAEAERQARQTIRRLRREHPEAEIVVTGCAAQIDPGGYAAMPEVDRVLGNAEKLTAEAWGREADAPRMAVGDTASLRGTASHLVESFEGRARAFVEVQQGCDHRCTFCIIPFGRGPSRSVPMGEVAARVRRLVASGYAEVVLTGVDITAYGPDLPGSPTLGQMVRRLLAAVPELPRLRLSSIDPVEVDEDLLALIADEPRLMPHLHLSLQAGDDMILKRMKRRHSRADAVGFVQRVRAVRPDVAFGADIIAGFPTETEAMFENTLALVADCDLAFLHVFPYSARRGTPAARMPQVPMALRRERAARLRAAGAAALARHLAAQPGREVAVLAETPLKGRSESFFPVLLDRPAEPGQVVRATVTGVLEGSLLGTQIGAMAA